MKKNIFIVGFLTALSLSFLGSLNAFAASLVIEVPDEPKPTTEVSAYQCNIGTNKERVEATYFNANNISLVQFKWKGEYVIASRSISASGARYVGGPYVWWIKGNEAIFSDLVSDPEEKNLIHCVEEEQETTSKHD